VCGQAYRQKLEAVAADIRKGLEGSAHSATPVPPDSAIGRLTRVDAMQSQQMALALRERQRIQLQRIEQALRFLEEGRYGTCVRCGEEISAQRLDASPESVLCVGCAK
jgi:DnaK suppressor protein